MKNVKVNSARFRVCYDAMFNCVHVHPLVQPFPFFQLALSVCVDTNVVQYVRRRYRNLDEFMVFTPAEFDSVVPFICAYMMMESLFNDTAVTRKQFDSQFNRWIRLVAPSCDYLCDNLDCLSETNLRLFFHSLLYV